MKYWRTQDVLLGTGSNKPGIERYGTDSDQTERIHSLPDGESVYAVSISPDDRMLAVGTKKGFLHLITHEQEARNKQSYSVQRIIHGAPILSNCFLGPTNLAATDTAGRCLIWDIQDKPQPKKLLTGSGMVCSLFQLHDGSLAGISSEREFHIWNWSQNEIVRTLEIPKLPALSALVKPVYWRKAESWVWPGRGGDIVLYSTARDDIRTIRAHAGDVYAVMVSGDELLTIGRTDGCLKRWGANSDKPLGRCEAPHGVISAAIWGDREFKVLLIKDFGRAAVYSFTDGQLDLIRWLAGQNYRVVFGPDVEKYQSELRQKRSLHISELAAQIKDKIRRRDYGGFDCLHQQLVELGCKDISLELRAEEARSKDDIVVELKSFKELTESIPENENRTKSSRLRYGQLLEKVWQLGTAYNMYERLSEIYPADQGCLANVKRLGEYNKVIECGEYVIEADIPLIFLVESAAVVDKPFIGRYQIGVLGHEKTQGITIAPESLVAKYEQVRQAAPKTPLPGSRQKKIWWFSAGKKKQVDIVIFTNPDSVFLNGLEFGIKFLNGGLQPVLIPVILFNAGEKSTIVSVKEHNESVFNKLSEIQSKDSSNKWLQVVHKSVSEAIGRLINKGLSERNRRMVRSEL